MLQCTSPEQGRRVGLLVMTERGKMLFITELLRFHKIHVSVVPNINLSLRAAACGTFFNIHSILVAEK